jgi:four helix bundle protein
MSRSDGLRVWHAAREFAEEVSTLARDLPRTAPARLRSQLAAAAHSVSSNIAEGAGRGTSGEMAQFFRLARGSLEETQSNLRICVNTSLIDRQKFYPVWNRSVAISRMLAALIDRLGKGRS